MKNKKNVILALWGITTVACLYMGELSAWQRRPFDMARCQEQGKAVERCRKEWAEDNQYDFESYLSPDSYKVYENFTQQKKTRAMDMADNNAMDPNTAVAKVASMRP